MHSHVHYIMYMYTLLLMCKTITFVYIHWYLATFYLHGYLPLDIFPLESPPFLDISPLPTLSLDFSRQDPHAHGL